VTIYKTTFTVTVFSQDTPAVDLESLSAIEYAITEGDCIGDLAVASVEEVPEDTLRDELVAIGNDGTFFDND
jgi:hypothetical protein